MQPQFRPGAYGHAGAQVQQRTPQSTQRRPGAGPLMTGAPPPPHRPGAHASLPAGVTQAQLEPQDHTSMNPARRKSRKPTDKTLPDGIENCLVETDVAQRYRDLRDLEQRLDASLTRKRLDTLDAIQRRGKHPQTLRIWISNTVEDQPWQTAGLDVDAFDFTPNMEASYRVKIEGRLLDDEYAAKANPDSTESNAHQKPKFTHFFDKVEVEFDKSHSRATADQAVTWQKSRAVKGNTTPEDFDELTFKRHGDENMNVTLILSRFEDPERYKLSPALADVVDMSEATRQQVMAGIWEYIRFMGLQEDEEKRSFRCDELLKQVVPGSDVCSIPEVERRIEAHLHSLPPVRLPYTIRVDEEFHKDPRPTIYDIEVTLDGPLQALSPPFIANSGGIDRLRDIVALDEQLVLMVEAISNSKARHSFFTSLAEDPASFIKDWLSSQRRDSQVVMGLAPRGGSQDVTTDEWRRGGSDSIWASSNARESVNLLLARPTR